MRGKVFRFLDQKHKRRDHPRLCGEKVKTDSGRCATRGSPPPMRGKVSNIITHCSSIGITPAYAGKRSKRLSLSLKMKDHPRLCGEKVTMRYTVTQIVGSPPPMRGKVPCVTSICKQGRITPAYAGKRVVNGFLS